MHIFPDKIRIILDIGLEKWHGLINVSNSVLLLSEEKNNLY